MRVLVTGANGFLGYYLCEQLIEKRYDVVATGKGDCRLPFRQSNFTYVAMDFTDPYSVHDVFQLYQPDIVIHAGAMSKPDECEQQQWQAYVTNVEGTLTLLNNAEELHSFFIFISTDFVFDGQKGMYSEYEETQPVNFYGKTKLEAEEAVKEYASDWAIVRTVMVYGKPQVGRGNLLTVVKEKIENGETYNVFNDQVRTPTYVEDLAAGILSIAEKKTTGIFHLCGTDILTPYEMAHQAATFLGLDLSLIKKITASDMAAPARRPLKTGLNIDKARKELNYSPISFSEGLRKTFS